MAHRRIPIFLASSTEDPYIQDDRNLISELFHAINDNYADDDTIYFRIIRCENYPNYVSINGKQADYNNELRNSDIAIFLFCDRVGKYTKEEFDAAYDELKKKQRIKIFTYFKKHPDGEIEEVQDFIKELLSKHGHYRQDYSDGNELKASIYQELINLRILVPGNEEINGDKIEYNGIVIADISKIPEVINNETLKLLQKKRDKLTKERDDLCEKKNHDPNTYHKKYLAACDDLDSINAQIKNLQKNLFRLVFANSETLENCRRLVSEQDYTTALDLLNTDKITGDIIDCENTYNAIKNRLQENVDSLLYRITVLRAKGLDKYSLEETEKLYGQALNTAEKYNLNKEFFYDYALFLKKQGNKKLAAEVAERLKHYYSPYSNSDVLSINKARLHALLGDIYGGNTVIRGVIPDYQLENYAKAQAEYEQAISIYEKQTKPNKSKLSAAYNRLGWVHVMARHEDELAMQCFDKALELQKDEQDKYIIASIHLHIGNLYAEKLSLNRGQKDYFKKSIQQYKAVEALYYELQESGINGCARDLALLYYDMGELYSVAYDCTQNHSEAALDYYKKSESLFKALYERHPYAYAIDYGDICVKIGNKYENRTMQNLIEAEKYRVKAYDLYNSMNKKYKGQYRDKVDAADADLKRVKKAIKDQRL